MAKKTNKTAAFISFILIVILLACFIVIGVRLLNNKLDKNDISSTVSSSIQDDDSEAEPLSDSSSKGAGTAISNVGKSGSKITSSTTSSAAKKSTFSGFTTVEESYFDDALFIGDSRTVGITTYGTLKNATAFCDVGMSVYNYSKKTLSVSGVGDVTLSQLLSKKSFGKIYVMLGVNEVGGNLTKNAENFKALVDMLHSKQPNAYIFIQANLHVGKNPKCASNINNANLNSYNNKIMAFADNSSIFYIDGNERFDDANGYLDSQYSSDGVHLGGKSCILYCEWLKTKGIA